MVMMDKERSRQNHLLSQFQDVFAELRRAEEKHPRWPDDPFRALAIITEEVGELAQAIMQRQYEGGSCSLVEDEATQVAAMGLRFFKNLTRMRVVLEDPRSNASAMEQSQ